MALERELKYSSPDGQVPALDELAAALAKTGAGAVDRGLASQTDVYYDDEHGSVHAAGMALRVRTVAGVRRATLKSRGSVMLGLHERDELEEELPAGAAVQWPAALARLLTERLQGAGSTGAGLAGLGPHMIISTERHRFDVTRGGVAVAELSFDEVVCRPAAEVALKYSIDEALFHEVELEALALPARAALTAGELKEIGRALQDLMPLYPSDITKLERAATLLGAFLE